MSVEGILNPFRENAFVPSPMGVVDEAIDQLRDYWLIELTERVLLEDKNNPDARTLGWNLKDEEAFDPEASDRLLQSRGINMFVKLYPVVTGSPKQVVARLIIDGEITEREHILLNGI